MVARGYAIVSALVLLLLMFSTPDVSGQGSTECATSPDGSHVSCGGLSVECATSFDGSHVSCGGQSARCTASFDGSHVSCGGQAGASRVTTSRHVSRGEEIASNP